MRILIVEDNVDFYNDYLVRLFGNLLPMDQIEMVHATTVTEALTVISKKWDVILMDYSLGKGAELNGHKIRDGMDLVRIRRAVEAEPVVVDGKVTNALAPSFIIGISNSQVGNRLMVEVGASTSFLKLQVVEIAKEIEQRL